MRDRTGAFALAAVNLDADATIAAANTVTGSPPVILALCQTNL